MGVASVCGGRHERLTVENCMCVRVRWIRVIFFFKQKTAYELRISDWSSDVCSSDLHHADTRSSKCALAGRIVSAAPAGGSFARAFCGGARPSPCRTCRQTYGANVARPHHSYRWRAFSGDGRHGVHEGLRSEEHTSELQSLMRISYAVFCLKKKKINKHK